MPLQSWVDFWDSDHAIYVNDRHKTRHAAAIGRDIARQIALPDAVVLDYGCGEALYAVDLARCCGQLILCEAADGVRKDLLQRLAGAPNIRVLDRAGVERLADASVDLVVANSLVQYLSRADLVCLLGLWRSKLKATGALVVADVVPPHADAIVDALALLRFGWRGGFLLATVGGLARTAFSDYGQLRKTLGFAMYDEPEFLSLLAEGGFRGARLRRNFGHNQRRLAFRAVPDAVTPPPRALSVR
jgi:SAM-dependent methyltransferase